jgi:hypothetical protein
MNVGHYYLGLIQILYRENILFMQLTTAFYEDYYVTDVI